jgi:acetyltransferase-like isoleucine patch superfamily enzyme
MHPIEKIIISELKRDMFLKKVRNLLNKAYIKIFCYTLPALSGKFYILFYKLIYPSFVLGKDCQIWGKIDVVLYGNGHLSLGDNCWIVSSRLRSGLNLFSRCKITVFDGAKIMIGNNVALNGTTITSKKSIGISDNTIIAPNVIIIDSDFHNIWPVHKRFYPGDRKFDLEVNIGKNVWIGMNTMILKGVKIGDNVVIGASCVIAKNIGSDSIIRAGSVVLNRIPENSLAEGNPARIISIESGNQKSSKRGRGQAELMGSGKKDDKSL